MSNFLENENRLLLACARSKMDNVNRNVIINFSNNISWDNFLCLASHHKLLPLAYIHLSNICPESVPDKSLFRLQHYYNHNLIENFKKIQSLTQVLEVFEKNSISVLTLKGPLITQLYYNDLGLRSYFDLDLLVDKKQFQIAYNRLKLLGYNNHPEGIPDNYFIKFAMLGHHGSVVNHDGVHVELHWELSGHYRGLELTYEKINSEIEYADLFGFRVGIFKIEFLLVYLALHGQQHYWQKYDYACCIAEVLRKGIIIDWNKVFDLAEQLNLKKVVLIALILTEKLFQDGIDLKFLNGEFEFLECLEIAEKYKRNYVLINNAIIKKQSQKWAAIIPRQAKVIGKKYDSYAMKQRLRKYFVPQVVDWEFMPLPYKFHFLYYVVKPFAKLFENSVKMIKTTFICS